MSIVEFFQNKKFWGGGERVAAQLSMNIREAMGRKLKQETYIFFLKTVGSGFKCAGTWPLKLLTTKLLVSKVSLLLCKMST